MVHTSDAICHGRGTDRSLPGSEVQIPCISGLVVEFIVAIDETRVRFPADAYICVIVFTSGESESAPRLCVRVVKYLTPRPRSRLLTAEASSVTPNEIQRSLSLRRVV